MKRLDWLEKARSTQLPPTGDWDVWFVMAGRGFGKTRTGAEDCAHFCSFNDGARYAIIAPTQADLRKTCFEGDSGLMSVLAPEMIQGGDYNKSLFECHLVNGSLIQGFSADKPDRLRGPQFHRALCLTENALITMADCTTRLIKDVKKDDLILTRQGPKKVLESVMTSSSAQLWRLTTELGEIIECTGDHPVWCNELGFIPAAQLMKGHTLCTPNLSSSMANPGVEAVTGIIPTEVQRNLDEQTRTDFIEQSGESTMERSPLVGMSTTSTKIPAIMNFLISRLSLTMNTCGDTALERRMVQDLLRRGRKLVKLISPDPLLKETVFSAVLGLSPSQLQAETFVGSSAPQSSEILWAQRNTVERSDQREKPKSLATPVENSSSLKTLEKSVAQGPVFSSDRVASVEKLEIFGPVYNLLIEDAHEFFANNILVHNCDELGSWRYPDAWDMLEFCVRLPEFGDPKILITTTPRPTKLVKMIAKAPGTIVTYGSTFDNSANLAKSFLHRVRSRYEGTRLGEQELLGKLLEDLEGSLWTRDMIKLVRQDDVPELTRVIVAIDPAVTAVEGSDETGIVVAGKGVDGKFYVMDDLSGVLDVAVWPRRACNAYHKYEADNVIGETNNGGDLVERSIKFEDNRVPFKKVTATRGKIVRAEPIAQLYEKNLVRHVGMFAELEDQMCTFNPAIGDTPNDRFDALVWALTELADVHQVEVRIR